VAQEPGVNVNIGGFLGKDHFLNLKKTAEPWVKTAIFSLFIRRI
jgi:hypothetical protein